MKDRNRKNILAAGGLWAAAALAAAGCASYAPIEWQSRAVPEAQGLVAVADGKPQQQRYKQDPFQGVKPDWSQYRTYAYTDAKPEIPVTKAAMPKDLQGDAKEGRKIFMNRNLGPCTGCHLIRGEDVWPAGNIGSDLQQYGDAGHKDEEIYQRIFDARVLNPDSIMPPWGASGGLTPQQIMHLVAFLKSQKGPLPPEKDANRDPNTRAKPPGFGDNLDPTNNPAVLLAEEAEADWKKKGSKGKACADCHEASPSKSMKGVGARYPRFVAEHGRVMALEEFLMMHSPATTGIDMPSEGDLNLKMTVLVKMQSNGMPLALDLTGPEAKAALERGEKTFFKRVGQRNHACADCHLDEPGKGGNKFLGGRLLATRESGMMNHFPTWRTNFSRIWDARKRFQWCLLPLGMNYLPSDSVEYAELELYVASFGQGKPLSVPGIRH
ncbi:MAG: sulfur oxidation c-type cytochrome SoxA [Magnetospirillum sp. WYHS-4]